MENDSSKLEKDLENGDDFLNEIIESNREMDNLLLESDFALETAESELTATIKDNIHSAISEEDETSSALSIEVSDDLFKGFTSDLNFSPLRYDSDKSKDTKFKEYDSQKLPDNLNNLLDDFNATLKCYNDVCQQDRNDLTLCNEFNEINDNINKTLIPDLQSDQENTESSDMQKKVNIKSLVAINSEEEHDYLYIDLYNTTLEITVPNNVDENLNNSPIATKLKHSNHFEGCSHEFDLKNIGNEYKVILNNEENISKVENHSCEQIQSDNRDLSDDNVEVSEECNEDFVKMIAKPIKMDNEFTSNDKNISFVNIQLEQNDDDKTPESVKTDNEFVNNNMNINFEQNDNVDETSKIDNEIISGDMSVTYLNFIQSELNNDVIDVTTELQGEKCLSNKEEYINNCVPLQNSGSKCSTLQITETATAESKVTTEITLNENNNIIIPNLKRPGEDITSNESKKQKINEKPATITKETTPETLKTDEIIIIPDDPVLSTTDINFTQAIFIDHEETADNNDPKWSALKDLETSEDYFKSVRIQWHSLSLPNPHKSNTTRYVPENIAKIKPQTTTSSENEVAISCGNYLEKRIQNNSNEISALLSKLNHLPRFKARSERSKINKEVEHLRHLQHELEKNQEELKHINMFYYNASQGWNAKYLTKPELTELEEQDQVLKFQEKFYK